MTTAAQSAPSSGASKNLLAILLLALLIRLLTYNGPFGSDDLVYFERAAALARGEWASSNYNGALRYGFNLPAAGFIALFGPSMFVANLWPLLASIIEIGAVYLFASTAMNRRAGIFAALLLATTPLHIAVATRIHADSVVSMFITLGFVLIYFGMLYRRPALFFAAGLAIGGIFWTKELAAVTWLAFLPIIWFLRGQPKNWLQIAAGTLLMMVLHGLLMTVIAGDPFHLIKVVLSAVKHNFIEGGDGEDHPAYYLRYLFFDLRHVGLIALLAVIASITQPHLIKTEFQLKTGYLFALAWLLGLLLVLSVFPVSLSPLRFTLKQSNYLTLFLAPIAILAGMAIAGIQQQWQRPLILISMATGILLGIMQQAQYRSFTANSKSIAAFAIEHPGALIVGSTNNYRLSHYLAQTLSPEMPRAATTSFRQISEGDKKALGQLHQAKSIFTVLDQQTMNWVAGKTPVIKPLPCWQKMQILQPADLAISNQLVNLASPLIEKIKPLTTLLSQLGIPQPATVYRIAGEDVFCEARR